MTEGKEPARPFIWRGVYPTWEAACAAADSENGERAFRSARWLDRITQQLIDYRTAFTEHRMALPPRPSNLPLVCAMSGAATVVDLGGSSGWSWDYLFNSLPTNQIASYVIVELESVVQHMRESGLHGATVSYQTSAEPLERCDVLYSNSVLQYFPSNSPLLSLVARTRPQVILLDDLVAHGDDDFFTTQTYFDSAIPYRFIGLGQLLRDLSELGYRGVLRGPYASPIRGAVDPFEMSNFPEEKRIRYSSTLLLSRVDRP